MSTEQHLPRLYRVSTGPREADVTVIGNKVVASFWPWMVGRQWHSCQKWTKIRRVTRVMDTPLETPAI